MAISAAWEQPTLPFRTVTDKCAAHALYLQPQMATDEEGEEEEEQEEEEGETRSKICKGPCEVGWCLREERDCWQDTAQVLRNLAAFMSNRFVAAARAAQHDAELGCRRDDRAPPQCPPTPPAPASPCARQGAGGSGGGTSVQVPATQDRRCRPSARASCAGRQAGVHRGVHRPGGGRPREAAKQADGAAGRRGGD